MKNYLRKRRIEKESWNLDCEIVKWLNEHIKAYYEGARTTIDLKYHSYKYKGNYYTLEAIIIRLIDITDELVKWYDKENSINPKEVDGLKNEMYDLLKRVHWDLWW